MGLCGHIIENSIIQCTYEINDNNEIQIINDRCENDINEEIHPKIKILNDGENEKLIFKKKFNKK